MQKPDPEATTQLRQAVEEVRETLFMLSATANGLTFARSETDVESYLQRACFNLGEAERELAAA